MTFLSPDCESLLNKSLGIKKLADKIYKFLLSLFCKHPLFFHKQASHDDKQDDDCESRGAECQSDGHRIDDAKHQLLTKRMNIKEWDCKVIRI